MENQGENTLSEGTTGKSPINSRRELDPVFLTLPHRSADLSSQSDDSEGWLQQLSVIETDCGPNVEQSLLVELLNRSTGYTQNLADRAEVQNYHNPLASLNAYKHRLQAIRCEYVCACLRAEDLEKQLAQIKASRAWKLIEKYRWWRRLLSRLVGPTGAE